MRSNRDLLRWLLFWVLLMLYGLLMVLYGRSTLTAGVAIGYAFVFYRLTRLIGDTMCLLDFIDISKVRHVVLTQTRV